MAAQDRSIWKLLTSQAAGAEMHDAYGGLKSVDHYIIDEPVMSLVT